MQLLQQLCFLAIAQIYVILFSISICFVSHLIAAYDVEIIAYNLFTNLFTNIFVVIVHIATIFTIMFGIMLIPIILVHYWIRNIENTYD